MPKYRVKITHQWNGRLWKPGEEEIFDAKPCEHWVEVNPPPRPSPELEKHPPIREEPFHPDGLANNKFTNPPKMTKRKPGRPKKK